MFTRVSACSDPSLPVQQERDHRRQETRRVCHTQGQGRKHTLQLQLLDLHQSLGLHRLFRLRGVMPGRRTQDGQPGHVEQRRPQ